MDGGPDALKGLKLGLIICGQQNIQPSPCWSKRGITIAKENFTSIVEYNLDNNKYGKMVKILKQMTNFKDSIIWALCSHSPRTSGMEFIEESELADSYGP